MVVIYRVGNDTVLVYQDDAPVVYDEMLGQYINELQLTNLFMVPIIAS